MSLSSPLLEQFIHALRCLPGVGPKSAQRMAMHLLARDRDGGRYLANMLQQSMELIHRCKQCQSFCETELCNLCTNPRRNQKQLCIVENPSDVIAIETTGFQGLYFVLHGHLSPIDGIGPDELGLGQLKKRLLELQPEEIILATNPTVEGDATALYIGQMARQMNITCSRLAHGVPIGGEIEYVDSNTLAHAFAGREELA